MNDKTGEQQLELIRQIHHKTGLSLEECSEAFIAAGGDGDKLSRLLEAKAVAKIKDSPQEWKLFAAFVMTKMKKIVNGVITIAVIIVVLSLARGPDGFVCKYMYPSAATETERALLRALAGCDCRQVVTTSEEINSQ